MMMTIYPNPHLPVTQSTHDYVSKSPVFSMELGNEYLSVTDDVDDTMMLQEDYFEGTEKEHEAANIRRYENCMGDPEVGGKMRYLLSHKKISCHFLWYERAHKRARDVGLLVV